MFDYSYNLFDLIGNIGAIVLVSTHYTLTAQKIDSKGFIYSAANLLAAILLTISLVDKPNISSLVIQIFWSLTSIYGIYQYLKLSHH